MTYEFTHITFLIDKAPHKMHTCYLDNNQIKEKNFFQNNRKRCQRKLMHKTKVMKTSILC